VEVFGTGVIGAVDNRGDGKTGRDAVFDSGGDSASSWSSVLLSHGCVVLVESELMSGRETTRLVRK
jgi:hypothetical protein